MLRSVKLAALFAAVIYLATSSVATASTLYDATADFGIGTNPTGAWTYGYLDNAATTFTPYAASTNSWHGNGNLIAWSQFAYDSGAYSVVGKNPTTDLQKETPAGSIEVDPGYLFTHPGDGGEKGTFRFTAPSAGTIDISALFRASDTTSGDRDVHVYINGVDQIMSNLLQGSKTAAAPISYSASGIAVLAGAKVDFAVGYGSDGHYFNDATMLQASVNFTPTPEPASLVLFGLGTIGLTVVARRRRAG